MTKAYGIKCSKKNDDIHERKNVKTRKKVFKEKNTTMSILSYTRTR